ncbi:MAG: SDR family oxidoreductase, partial [Clostridiales bacterium]|nr:SDR family oxidoreductase [Clostridiales bacterium]
LQSLTENIARQTAADGVNVNMLLPGVIATPRNEEALSDPVYREQVLAKIPAGYAGEAGDCAHAALLLCSNEGRYITGSQLYADGGMHL